MSSDSSSQYDGNVLYDDDELISRSGSQSSVIIEADSTPCFHPEQPNFIPPTSDVLGGARGGAPPPHLFR